MHVEKANGWSDYERKEANFTCSDDKPGNWKIRFGKLTEEQHCILKLASDQNDREIDVYLDKKGGKGKSWLARWLWERGHAYVVPRSVANNGRISADCCTNCGNRDYIILDVQRNKKLVEDWYSELEELKDGLVSDPRYHGRQTYLADRTIIVFTNKELDTKKLSSDRWRLHSTNLREMQ